MSMEISTYVDGFEVNSFTYLSSFSDHKNIQELIGKLMHGNISFSKGV